MKDHGSIKSILPYNCYKYSHPFINNSPKSQRNQHSKLLLVKIDNSNMQISIATYAALYYEDEIYI